jgi:iron complex outermembrane receptor protein
LERISPERGQGYEAGVTASWPGVDLAVTWFDISKRGTLTTDPADPKYLAPVGKLTSRGLEVDAAAKVGRRWQLVANYAYTPARADDAAFATDAVLNVPDYSAKVFALGRFLNDRGRGVSLSCGATYIGDRAATLNTSGLALPAYVKLKAAAEYAFSPTYSLRLEADNLLNERHA